MNVAYIPNSITILRILGTMGFIFTKPFTKWFFLVYFFTGVTDVLDGFLARRLKATSNFGAKLDSVADLFFHITMIVKILPFLIEMLPVYIWFVVGIIAILRIVCYIVAAGKFKEFASLHTIMNKATGVLIFTVPFVAKTSLLIPVCIIVCVMGIVATSEELLIHIKTKDYKNDVKTIL